MKRLPPAMLLVSSVLACSGASPSSGQNAYMRVQNAQFISGPIDTEPHADAPGIEVATRNNVHPVGVTGKSITGSAGPGSTAVLIGMLGDSGHWVVPVQDEDTATPGNFTFACSVSFSALTPTDDGGALQVVVRATDKNGNLGPARLQPTYLEEKRPEGALVISLDWDTEADLDLHVVLPTDGDAGVNEIWSRKPSGLATGTVGATVDDGQAAGYLDFDSNSQCVIDGRRVENVIFPTTAPSGHYIVRVDTFSLCSEVTARWRLQVFSPLLRDPIVRYGQSTDYDTRFAHGQGAGANAYEFDYNP
jgi:hypothetical protein